MFTTSMFNQATSKIRPCGPFRLKPLDPEFKVEDTHAENQNQSNYGTSPTDKMTSASTTYSTRPLSSLPPEIVLQILEESRPDGIENLALTSKAVYSLARSRLIPEHNAFKHRYSICRVDGPDPTGCWDRELEDPKFKRENPNLANPFLHPVYLLQELQANPIAARYTRYLELGDFGEGNLEDVKDKAKQLNLAFLEDNFYIEKSKQNAKKWADGIIDGNTVYSKILLLLLLPNIEPLRPCNSWEWELEESCNDGAKQVLDAIATDDRPQRALSRLTQIAPWTSHVNAGTPLEMIRPFMALPLMRRLVGFHVFPDEFGSDHGMKYEWPYRDRNSAVKAVECTNSAADRKNIEAFLAPIKTLQSFKWDNGGFENGAESYFNGDAFSNGLKSHVSKTIKQLTLTGSGNSLTAIDSFREFENLEYLEFEVKLLYGEHDQGENDMTLLDRLGWDDWDMDYEKFRPPKLIDILLRSLRQLRLINGLKQVEINPLFNGFVEGREGRLPALSKIKIAAKKHLPEKLKRQMKEAGIEVERSDSISASHYTVLW